MTRQGTRTGQAFFASVVILLLVAPSVHASSIADITARGELVMLCFPHQGNAFVDVNLELGPMPKIGGPEHFKGIDVELMSAFAEELGVALRIRAVSKPSYKGLVPDLLAGKGDLIASSFSITGERKKRVAFSQPYYSAQPLVLGLRGSAAFTSIDDLAGKRVVTISGSSNHARLRNLGISFRKLIEVDFMSELFAAIIDREADFTMIESPAIQGRGFVPRGLAVVYRIPVQELYGVAVPYGSDLRERLDVFLDKMKETGKLGEIVMRHIGLSAESSDQPR